MLQLTRHWSGLTQDTRAKFESIIAAQFCRYTAPAIGGDSRLKIICRTVVCN